MFSVWIEPHERQEAIEAYRDWLTPSMIDEIENAPDNASIVLNRGKDSTALGIIPRRIVARTTS